MLEGYIYLILGTWSPDEEGRPMQFREDGTCTFEGQERYFDVNGYAVLIGGEPEPSQAVFQIVSMDAQRMTLKREEDGATVRYTRVQPAQDDAAGQEGDE